MMRNKKALIAAFTATTFLTAGVAFAESQPAPASPPQASQQTTVDKDFGTLSAQGSRAYQDVTLTRLAIFDGRTNDAKKYIDEADTDFGKAKADDTVFMKAEGDLKTADQMKAKSGEAKADNVSGGNQAPTAKTPIAWLPVDGVVGLNADYTLNPMKSKAVADANKSLESGDRKGAMDKLKLADVDMNVVLAVVPLNQTMSDVHQAAQLIDSGKYYEGSQALRKINASTRYDVEVISGAPKLAASKTAPVNGAASASPSTGTPKTQ